MKVIAPGQTGGAGFTQNIAFGDGLACFDHDLIQMGVHTEQPETVIDKNSPAVYTQLIGEHHHTVVGRRYGCTFGRSQVGTQMDLSIDFLTFIGICTMISETRSRS